MNERNGLFVAQHQRPDHGADAARRREKERRNVMTRILLLSLVLAAAAPAQPVGASQNAPAAPWPVTVSSEPFKSIGSRGYLASVLNLLDREAEALASERLKVLYLDILGTRLAMVGEHERATRRGDEAYPRQHESATRGVTEALLKSYRPVSALEAIIEAAHGRRLVMVNEEHRSTIQRAFSNRLLVPLRQLGFTYLAVETIHEDTATLNERGYPVLETGTYTDDPAFGDLIRRAIGLGYTVLAYEPSRKVSAPRPEDTSPVDAMNRRERGQARNIFERTFQKDPDARVLVVSGRDHIAENTGGRWTPMGGILKELSGIDPVTFDLFGMVEHSRRELEHWAFRTVDDAAWLADEPVVLVDDKGGLWSRNPDGLDASVFHPRTTYVHGRPHWMSMGGLRSPHVMDCPGYDEPVLLQALFAGESVHAVPLDQTVWWPDRPKPALLLRPGAYRVRVIDRSGRALHRVEVRID
ncbi:MAG: hypothetical protein V3T84_13565 [Phycisphaerales bacterium]